MLGTRTKQVNSYGRRGSRIVSVSDRQNHASVNSSTSEEDTLAPPRPIKRENAIIASPKKPHRGSRRLLGSSHSPRSSPLVQNRAAQLKATRNVTATAKRTQYKLDYSVRTRQPLTPIRPNTILSNEQPLSGIRGKSTASTIKPGRASLKPHVPVIAVDIIVLDGDGTMLKQERRLSHTEIQADKARAPTRKGRKIPSMLPPSPRPIPISDDSDTEVVSPRLVVSRLYRRPRPIVISSDEDETGDNGSVPKKAALPMAKFNAGPRPQRVGVVSPTTPYRRSETSEKPLLPLTPARAPALLAPSFRPGSAAIPSLLAPPILPVKPRQLTPIRGTGRSAFRRPPPTPSTPTEADLSLDLAQLDISGALEIDDSAPALPEYLIPLLHECVQASPYEFSAFIETFPFDPIVQSSSVDEDAKFRKIGEASYSEVFGIGDVVLKVIPIRSDEEPMRAEADDVPAPSDAKDVLKEIIVTREIGEICDKFVKLLKTYVVRGRYPSLLLDLWDEYNNRKGSESIRPDSFGLTQVYVIIILPNGGPDLESFVFRNVAKSGWHQACGVFWQVARALEQAERLANFEHRDLHWGQILVKSIPVKKSATGYSVSQAAMDDTRFGVDVTIIDLGLSRMSTGNAQGPEIYWTPFEDEIFEGEGDYQYDIYRMMRDLIGGTWKSFHPFTNVLWLHYLVTKLLHEKRLKVPGRKREREGESRTISPTGYSEQECYDCLAEMEKLLGNCINSSRKGRKARRKTVAPSNGPKSARDVIAHGMRRGWIR